MSNTNAISSMGTKFYRWSGSAWVEMGDITAVEGPQKTRDTLEVTQLNSDDQYKEFIADLKDGGTANLTASFVRANYDLIATDFESTTAQSYAIVLPDTDNTTVEFEGLVIEQPLAVGVGDKISADVSIKVTGKPLHYDGSSAFS